MSVEQVYSKNFRVTRAVTTLTAAQAQALARMMTSCFGLHDLERACHLYTGERLDHIVGSGPLRKMAEDLIRWCEEQQDKLVPLLNGIVKERPGRSDLPDLLRKLATEGAIEIEG